VRLHVAPDLGLDRVEHRHGLVIFAAIVERAHPIGELCRAERLHHLQHRHRHGAVERVGPIGVRLRDPIFAGGERVADRADAVVLDHRRRLGAEQPEFEIAVLHRLVEIGPAEEAVDLLLYRRQPHRNRREGGEIAIGERDLEPRP